MGSRKPISLRNFLAHYVFSAWKTVTNTLIAILVIPSFISLADGVMSPGRAREKLEEMHIHYASEQFVDQAGRANDAAIELFLAAGMNPNTRDQIGRTALMATAAGGRVDGPEFLPGGGRDAAGTRGTVRIPRIIQEDRRRRVRILRTLVAAGADINATDKFGETALFHAVKWGCAETMLTLLESGADRNIKNRNGRTALIEAALASRRDIVITMLEKNIPVEVKGSEYETSLFEATLRGGTESVRALLSKGAYSNAQTPDGFTVLMAAAALGHKDIVTVLLDNGANVNAKDRGMVSALFAAVKNRNREIVRLLLENHADPNDHNEYGTTVLMLAAGDADITLDLLEGGADVNATDKMGFTPLFYAAWSKHLDCVRILIERGARLEMTDKFGQTALMHAERDGNSEVAELLKDALRPNR